MSRLKTVGFETNSLVANGELFNVLGSPIFYTNIDPNSGQAAVWNDLTEEWNSETVVWPISTQGAVYDPAAVRSGYFALRFVAGDHIAIKASSKGGGGYNRVCIKLHEYPDLPTTICHFIRDTDDVAMAGLEIQPDGRLRLYYRSDAGAKSYIGDYSNPLTPHAYNILEVGMIGNELGTTRTITGRLNELVFASQEVTDQSSYTGYFGVGMNYGVGTATTGIFFADDLATNDGNVYDWDQENNTWAGNGKIILLPVVGNDELVGDSGFTRGGDDTGSQWGQVSDASPPDDANTYLIGSQAGHFADFRVGSPYDFGVQVEDSIKVVAANVRWAMEDASESAQLNVYLRAGSNLPKDGNTISLFGTAWFTADASGRSPDVFSTDRLPQTSDRWTPESVASARVGMQIVNDTPDMFITSMYVLVEFVPYGDVLDYSIEINGVERVADVELQSLAISDKLNEQANTAAFRMYDLHSLGVPATDDEIIVRRNGYKIFAGNILNVTYEQLGRENDVISVSCVDYTHILDRRLVSMTIQETTDKAAIQTIIDQFAANEGIGTYFVAEAVTISQLTLNYVPVSQALKQIAELAGKSWYIDYDKQLHYFPRQQGQAPFQITANSALHKDLQVQKDSSRLRNRIFVRGGVERTTSPITETVVADGEQTQFLLAEKPHDLEVTVNGVPKTVGIKNIDDAADFDFLMNFQEKYVEVASASTPANGDDIAFTYSYDVPILVSVEDSDSIAESGVYEFVILDQNIESTEQARARAVAELTDYAADIVDATYVTYEPGIRSGQYQRINIANKGVDEDYLVSSVVMRSLGGGRFVYDVKLTNAKTMGIIKFLLELLQTDRRVGLIDPNEKVDQLLSLTDTLDSMLDSVSIDSQGYGFVWSNDAGTTPNKLRWDLGSWL